MDALKVLHDYCYIEPEHPVPRVGTPTRLGYTATESMPAVIVDLDSSGFVRMTITVLPDDLAEALKVATDDLVSNLGGDPSNDADVSRIRDSMGADTFDMQVSSLARTYFLSAAVMRTGIFPLMQPTARDLGVIDPATLAQPYTYSVTFPLLPSGELTSYDPVEIDIPQRPSIEGNAIKAKMRSIASGGASDKGAWEGELPAEDTEEFANLRGQAVKALEVEASSRWSEELMTVCNHELSHRLREEPPLNFVPLVANQMRYELDQRLRNQGSSYEAYVSAPGFDKAAFEKELTDEAELSLRTSIAVDAMADHIGVMVNRRELLESVGEKTGDEDHDRAIISLMMMTGQLPELLQVSRRYKTSDVLARQALNLYEQKRASVAGVDFSAAAGASSSASAPIADQIAASAKALDDTKTADGPKAETER